MEPQALRAFLAVAETGSFTLAARRVFRSQPAVSMAVRALEEELGRELFHRLPQGVRLTEAGEGLRELAEPLLRDWDSARERLDELLDGELRGRLVIGAGEAILLHWLPGIVQPFRKRHPGVAVVLRNQPREASFEQLRSGEVDVAVRSVDEEGAGFDLRHLLTTERCVVAPRGTGLPRRPSAAQLARHAFVVPRAGAKSRGALEALFSREGLRFEIAVESGGWALLLSHVAMGLGLAIVPAIALSAADERRFEVRRLGALLGEERYAVVFHAGSPPRRAALAFAEACVARAK